MLIRFLITNYLSFREETEFNLLTGSVRTLPAHVYRPGSDLELLRAAAIYGPNGAGKTNFVKALEIFQRTLSQGRWEPTYWQPSQVGPQEVDLPAQFEAEIVLDGQSYAYGLSVKRDQITEEWLYRTFPDKDDELLFERQAGKSRLQFSPAYLSTHKDQLRKTLYEEEVLSASQPLLSLMAAAGDTFAEARAVWCWFKDSLQARIIQAQPKGVAASWHGTDGFRAFARDLLATLDLGISDVIVGAASPETSISNLTPSYVSDLQAAYSPLWLSPQLTSGKTPPKPPQTQEVVLVYLDAQGNRTKASLEAASEGTLAMLELLPLLYGVMYQGQTAVIDGLGRGLHPGLLQALLRAFFTQPTSGQLIFTTHEAQLLDQTLFRRDEIWLTEKDGSGQTRMYPLSDFKIRYDLDIRKGYLNGRFGAIPRLHELEGFDWKAYGAEKSGV